MAQKVPTPLQDAIRAQQSVINQLAEEHAAAQTAMAVKGDQLARAHAELTTLLNQQQAER